MNITLETIREVLREPFGRDSIVASFVQSVSESDAVPTAGINSDGRLIYNPQFVEEHVSGVQDLFCLICHEMMHPLFGHFIYEGGTLENIAADMVINAVITQLFWEAGGQGSLFKKVYRNLGLDGLLRPESQMTQSRYSDLYNAFYFPGQGGPKYSTGEVIQTLRILTPTVRIKSMFLLGNHVHQGAASDEPIKGDALERLAEDFQKTTQRLTSEGVGYSATLRHILYKAYRTHLSIRRVLLQKLTTRKKLDRFKEQFHHPRMSVSPIPLHPSKRDLVLLSAGAVPLHFSNQVQGFRLEDRGLAVYLDVSGSVNKSLPKIIGILSHLKQDLCTIFLFSNKVVEVPFKRLLQGRLQTTIGTDFNCVAKSILERELDKAVILTDGYAYMTKETTRHLKKQKLTTLTILFGDKVQCPEWAPFGDVVQLEDITT